MKNNLHPVWYEVSDDGELVRDKDGNKVPHFEMPPELKRLSMAEKFLIWKCSNYVPLVHLSNGVFALKGHCVTFPQDNQYKAKWMRKIEGELLKNIERMKRVELQPAIATIITNRNKKWKKLKREKYMVL